MNYPAEGIIIQLSEGDRHGIIPDISTWSLDKGKRRLFFFLLFLVFENIEFTAEQFRFNILVFRSSADHQLDENQSFEIDSF